MPDDTDRKRPTPARALTAAGPVLALVALVVGAAWGGR